MKRTFGKDGFKPWLGFLKQKWERQRTAHRKALALKQSDVISGNFEKKTYENEVSKFICKKVFFMI